MDVNDIAPGLAALGLTGFENDGEMSVTFVSQENRLNSWIVVSLFRLP